MFKNERKIKIMKVDYIKNGDYFIPNLELETNKKYPLNKYGLLLLEHIKKQKKTLYNELIITNKLNTFLFSASEEAVQKVDNLMKEFIKNDPLLSEEKKETNQLEWVKLMNNYKNRAEEIILKELIFD